MNLTLDKRVRIIVGHYGSGKTEFSINYALQLADLKNNLSIIDLDIVNPYFRSREKAELLEEQGIKVISSSIGNVSTLDIPALSAGIYGPLQDKNCDVVIDVGGDAAGARTLGRFKKEILATDYDMFFIFNANRERTQTATDTIEEIKAIEKTTGLKITGIVNNTHLLKATKIEDVLIGQKLAETVSQESNIPIEYVCILEALKDKLALKISTDMKNRIFPIKLYMREEWMT